MILLTTFDASTRVVAHQDVSARDVERQAKHLDVGLVGVPLHSERGVRRAPARRARRRARGGVRRDGPGVRRSGAHPVVARGRRGQWPARGRVLPACGRTAGANYDALAADLEKAVCRAW